MSICEDIDLTPPPIEGVLTPGAVAFAADLERKFRARRAELLETRRERLAAMAIGESPRLARATSEIRRQEWQIAARPENHGLLSVDVLSPTDPAVGLSLVSGIRLCVTDCALAANWSDLLAGHAAIRKAKQRQTNRTALTAVRPRSLDVDESNMMIDGLPMSASIFDFAMSIYHSAKSPAAKFDSEIAPLSITRQRFELAGVENHLEARFWDEIFEDAHRRLGLAEGTIGAIVAIDTHPALFELDEILYELRHRGAALRSIGGIAQANLVAATSERRGALCIEPTFDLTSCENSTMFSAVQR